jgi:two-component system LytT family response regulator
MESAKKDSRILAMQTLSGLVLVFCERMLLFDYSKENRCWQMTLNDNSKQSLRQNTTAKEILAISSMLMQISQECIVNLKYVATFDQKTLQCRFYKPYDSIERMVSRRYLKIIKEQCELI